ncbi:MAG: glycosyltransferase family 2 protein [Opitutales bacterium]
MKVSVIIPCYNRADVIGATLDAVLNQHRPPEEVIVVDDGSTDGSANYLRTHYGHRVRVIEQPNGGPGSARNTGLKVAQGEYVEFMDSDDIPTAEKLFCQVRQMDQTGADVAYGPWTKVRIEADRLSGDGMVLQSRGLPRTTDLAKALMTTWSVVLQSGLFRRATLEANGVRFPTDLFAGEDQVFLTQTLLMGSKMVFSPRSLLLYRAEGPANKLTADTSKKERFFLHWGEAQLRQRALYLDHNRDCDPLRWYRYRLRLWDTASTLETFGTAGALAKACEIRALLDPYPNRLSYALGMTLQQKGRSLKSRLVGHRHPVEQRVAHLGGQQRKILEAAGWHWAS